MSKFMNCHGHGKEALHLTPIYFYSFWHRSISLCDSCKQPNDKPTYMCSNACLTVVFTSISLTNE